MDCTKQFVDIVIGLIAIAALLTGIFTWIDKLLDFLMGRGWFDRGDK